MVDPRAGKGSGGRLVDASAAESNSHSATTSRPTPASPGYCGVEPVTASPERGNETVFVERWAALTPERRAEVLCFGFTGLHPSNEGI
jgi:hypothetical protein